MTLLLLATKSNAVVLPVVLALLAVKLYARASPGCAGRRCGCMSRIQSECLRYGKPGKLVKTF